MDRQTQTGALANREIEITDAAIGTFGRLFRSIAGTVRTHAAGDGGLICEDGTMRARPVIWRISPDGAVVPDRRYDFAAGGFIATVAPSTLTAG